MSIHRTNDADVQASLSLANSSVQPGDNVSDLTNDAGYVTATLTQEQVEDYAGALVATGGTKTLITVTYDDINGNMDFVVDNNLANYDNSTSGFLDATTVEAQVDHVNIANIGTNTHAQIDTHIADATLHFTEASIDHGSISGLGDNDHPQYVLLTDLADTTPGSDGTDLVGIPVIGSPAIDDLGSYIGATSSIGTISGGVITDSGSGQVDISAWAGILRATDSLTSETLSTEISASTNVSLTDASNNYIFADYNSGTPAFTIETTLTTVLDARKTLLCTVYRDGTTLHITNAKSAVGNFPETWSIRSKFVDGIQRESGCIIGETGTRNISLSAGECWLGIDKFSTAAFDSSGAGTFIYYYRDGVGGFTEVASQTQISNTQYDDGSGTLATLGTHKYGNAWVYLDLDSGVHVLYGRDNYSLNSANAAAEPLTKPPNITEFHTQLVGKIIIQEGASSFTTVQTPFTTVFNGVGTTDHGELTGLADDDHSQYLLASAATDRATFAANWTDLTDAGDSTLHYHATDRARANHTGTQTAATISDFDTEVSNNTDVAANTSARHVAVTVTDSSEIDFTLTGQDITASLIAASVDETKLDVSVNASLDLADSAAQSGDNVSIFTNDANYLTAATVEAQVDHVNIASIGTNTHAQIDSHIGDGTIHFTQGAISIPASQISDFDAEVANNTDVAANTSARHVAVTVTDSSEIDFTLTGQDITASLVAGSIDETKLDTSVNASLDLADSALQSGDVTTATIAAATLVTAAETIAANNNDTTIPTSAAVKAYADSAGGHDAVTVTDSAEIDFTLTGQDITASLIASSIDETKLDTSVNASLDLADSAYQSGDSPTFAAITATTSISLGNTDTLQFSNLAATGDAIISVDTGDKFTFREISGGGFEWEAEAGTQIMTLSAAGALTVGGNFTLGGGIFNIGPVEVVEISAGVITYTQSSLTVQPEGLSGTDSLTNISGGSNGDILILRTGANNRDITVVNGSGNIDCGANITMLTVADRVMLMKQGANWSLISQAIGN